MPLQESSQSHFFQKFNLNCLGYKIKLLWKEVYPSWDVPDHFHLCFNYLIHLQQRLLKTSNILQECNQIVREHLDQRIIKAIVDLNNSGASHVQYLPHHTVICQDKQTTKVCVVYDESAKAVESPLSITDCLLTSPNLIPKLFNVLIRFHWSLIAITADIEKAFLIILINQNDRDMLCFLWFKDSADVNNKINHFRFTWLVFGLRPSPGFHDRSSFKEVP